MQLIGRVVRHYAPNRRPRQRDSFDIVGARP
jgi:hypothetical protein